MFGFLWRMFHGGGLGTRWCSLLHDAPMWPIREHYECCTGGRQYRVPWAGPERPGAPRIRQPLLSFGSALVTALLLMAVPGTPSLRGQSTASDSSATAAAVLEYSVDRSDRSCPVARGGLSAIRSLLPAGDSEHLLLWITGDSKVTKEVIVRYVSADARTNELPASSVLRGAAVAGQ
jgi:hypothetical protein